MGCESQPEMDVVLDTGASSSILPYECMQKLVRDGGAMELESHSVVLADGREQRIDEFLIDGLMLGTCEIHSVRVLCCKDLALEFPPVLGVDILQRLRNFRIRLSPDGGSISSTVRPADWITTIAILMRENPRRRKETSLILCDVQESVGRRRVLTGRRSGRERRCSAYSVPLAALPNAPVRVDSGQALTQTKVAKGKPRCLEG